MTTSSAALAHRMHELFRGYDGAHGTFGTPVREERPSGWKWSIKSTAITTRQPVTVDLWVRHLEGKQPLGIMPFRVDGTCLWSSIDIDDYDLNILEVIKRIEKASLPLVPVRSKSGGLHLFLFFREPQAVSQVYPVLRDLAARLGFADSEIFPKETNVLFEKGALGTWMAMPYYGDTFGGKLSEQVALRQTGAELTLEQFLDAAEGMRVGSEQLAKLAWTPRTRGPAAASIAFGDGPPCLQHLASQGVPQGQQNSTLFMMGLYYKKKDPGNWQTLLETANRTHLNPPGSSEGVAEIIRRLERKDYEYTCKTQPMAAHCNSAICRTRRHGVGTEGDFPILGGIQRTDADPPRWFVTVGVQQVECTTDDLQMYMRFHRACLDQLNYCYRSMRQDAWLEALGAVMTNVIMVPTGSDVGIKGQFFEILEEFLTDRRRGNKRDDLLSGRPYEETAEQRYYFRLKDLMQMLDKQGLRVAGRTWVILRIREIGGDNHFFNIGGRGCKCWWVPSSVVTAPPAITLPAKRISQI